MSPGALRRRALLSGTMLMAAVVGYGRRAYAACVNLGGTTYCSGAQTATLTINANNANVRAEAGFSVNAATGNGIVITGDGAISYTDTNASPVSASTTTLPYGAALYVRSNGDYGPTSGSVTINTNGALTGGTIGILASNNGGGALTITANGDVTGTTNVGIFAYNSALGTDLSVTTGPGATVGETIGINAQNHGTGALTVAAYGNVTGTNGAGISANNSSAGTDLSVTTGVHTTVSGSSYGIWAHNDGRGALTITANGDVTGTSSAGSSGIVAYNSTHGTDLSVTTGPGTVSGAVGIDARNHGSGALTVTANGDVTGLGNIGIYAQNNGTDLSVTTGPGTVSGARFGIYASNAGTGALTITANGNVTGTTSRGIYAYNSFRGTDLSVTTGANTTVSGSSTGIFASNYGTGALTITANGDVAGAGAGGIGIVAINHAGTDLGVTTGTGTTVSGATGIFASGFGTGALAITANGDVTGTNGKGIYAFNSSAGTDLSVTTGAYTTVSGSSTGIDARNYGARALTITANGDVTGTSTYGIKAYNSSAGTDLSVTTGAGTTVSGSTRGIDALNYGRGALRITANGDVTSTAVGIYASNSHSGTDLSVTTGANSTVRGSTGISALNFGIGALTVTANGDVISTSGFGIFAYNSSPGTDLSVTTGVGTTVSGGTYGIVARNYGTGALAVIANGNVTATTGDAIFAQSSTGPIDITVAATGTVTAADASAFAIETVGGPATVTVAGTVAGAMQIGGTLTFERGSTYKVFVTPGTASLANVSGTATLDGTVNASFAAGHYMQKQYTILTAAGGLGNTTFSSLSTANLPPGFLANLSYDADDVFLNLVLGTLSTSGLNRNQGNVANAVNTFFNNGGALPPGFVTLAGQTGNAQSNGLSQVSGEAGADTTQASFDAMSAFMNVLLDPFNDGHLGAGPDGGALGFAQEGPALGYAGANHANDKASQAYSAVTPKDRMAVKAPAFAARWNVWASGYGGSSKVSGDAATGSHDTTSRIYGTAAGADYRLSPDTLLGFALGGAGFNFGLSDGLGSGRADLFQAGLYGRHFIGNAYIAGALAYGWQDVTTDRTVTVAGTDKLEAEFHAQTFAARAEGGYRFATPWLGVTPYGALQVTSFVLPSYAETATSGSNQFALSYASQTTTNLRTELGARFDKSFLVADGLFTLRGRLAWAHDSNTDRPVSAAFQTLPGASFTVNGAAPAADGALVSAGAQIRWNNGFSLAGTFEGEFSGTTQSYAGKGTLSYTFN